MKRHTPSTYLVPVALSLMGLLLGLSAVRDEEPAPGPAVQVSTSCARCHSNAPGAWAMRDSQGHGIAPYDLWQSTMMANAARDPLWRAVVSVEVAATPSRREAIERKCLGCHAPMAARIGLEEHDTGSLMHVLDCDSELGDLARDGVSCTVCHGISPEGLGSEASFGAGFELDAWRRIYGPHEDPFPMPMAGFTGFTPTHGEHVLDSALCGSCHTLETDAYDADGNEVGARLVEQAPYLEWRNSAFDEERPEPGPAAASCQDCHVPQTDASGDPLSTRIARNPGGRDFPATVDRSPFGRHLFVGGNTLVLGMLRDAVEELGVMASPEALARTIDATRTQLRERTARIAIDDVRREDGALAFDVEVTNLTGHKLPTGHPTRRVWLQVLVRDADGRLLFASGRSDARGRIVDGEGVPLPSELSGGPVEPHRDLVRSSDEVATYEAVMADSEGAPTHLLLRGARWLLDDRLLPRGWDPDHAEAKRTRPIAVEGDENFRDGRDRVRYECRLPTAAPVTIEATLLYQTLGARYAAEILEWPTPEVARFRELYEKADRTPEVLATARWR